jgi:hypothetical protein
VGVGAPKAEMIVKNPLQGQGDCSICEEFAIDDYQPTEEVQN